MEWTKNFESIFVSDIKIYYKDYFPWAFWQANPVLPENFNITGKCVTTVFSAKLSLLICYNQRGSLNPSIS